MIWKLTLAIKRNRPATEVRYTYPVRNQRSDFGRVPYFRPGGVSDQTSFVCLIDQRIMVPSSWPVTKRSPLEENATEIIMPWSSSRRKTASPSATFQMTTSPREVPVASKEPSGEKVRSHDMSGGPGRVFKTLSADTSTRKVLFRSEQAAMIDFGENDTQLRCFRVGTLMLVWTRSRTFQTERVWKRPGHTRYRPSGEKPLRMHYFESWRRRWVLSRGATRAESNHRRRSKLRPWIRRTRSQGF